MDTPLWAPGTPWGVRSAQTIWDMRPDIWDIAQATPPPRREQMGGKPSQGTTKDKRLTGNPGGKGSGKTSKSKSGRGSGRTSRAMADHFARPEPKPAGDNDAATEMKLGLGDLTADPKDQLPDDLMCTPEMDA